MRCAACCGDKDHSCFSNSQARSPAAPPCAHARCAAPPRPGTRRTLAAGASGSSDPADTPANPADTPAELIFRSARVEPVGLAGAGSNGQLAAVAGPRGGGERFAVTTDKGRELAINLDSLRVVTAVSGAAVAGDPGCCRCRAFRGGSNDGVRVGWVRPGAPGRPGAAEQVRPVQTSFLLQPHLPEEALEPPRPQARVRGAALLRSVCLEGGDDPPPPQCGCACRGEARLARVACKARAGTTPSVSTRRAGSASRATRGLGAGGRFARGRRDARRETTTVCSRGSSLASR